MLKTSVKFFVIASLFCVAPAFAGWQLDAEQSTLNFISIKKDTVAELHHFKQLQGHIADSGEFEFSISLGSVETQVPIRNERLQEFLFEVARFPLATGSGKLANDELNKLAVGSVQSLKVPVQINLHGKIVTKELALKVEKLQADKLWVVTEAPFIINAEEFDLTGGIAKLKELAGVANIAQAVPVTASLVFKADNKPQVKAAKIH